MVNLLKTVCDPDCLLVTDEQLIYHSIHKSKETFRGEKLLHCPPWAAEL